MLLTENFIDIVLKANRVSSKIAGCLLAYDIERNIVEIPNKDVVKARYRMRAKFLFLNAAFLFTRAVSIQLQMSAKTKQSQLNTNLKLCIMMMFACISTAERYRVRGNFPEDYGMFLNRLLQVERDFINGNHNSPQC